MISYLGKSTNKEKATHFIWMPVAVVPASLIPAKACCISFILRVEKGLLVIVIGSAGRIQRWNHI